MWFGKNKEKDTDEKEMYNETHIGGNGKMYSKRFDKETFKENVKDNVKTLYRKKINEASQQQIF